MDESEIEALAQEILRFDRPEDSNLLKLAYEEEVFVEVQPTR
jgi:hypothetical protein